MVQMHMRSCRIRHATCLCISLVNVKSFSQLRLMEAHSHSVAGLCMHCFQLIIVLHVKDEKTTLSSIGWFGSHGKTYSDRLLNLQTKRWPKYTDNGLSMLSEFNSSSQWSGSQWLTRRVAVFDTLLKLLSLNRQSNKSLLGLHLNSDT